MRRGVGIYLPFLFIFVGISSASTGFCSQMAVHRKADYYD